MFKSGLFMVWYQTCVSVCWIFSVSFERVFLVNCLLFLRLDLTLMNSWIFVVKEFTRLENHNKNSTIHQLLARIWNKLRTNYLLSLPFCHVLYSDIMVVIIKWFILQLTCWIILKEVLFTYQQPHFSPSYSR